MKFSVLSRHRPHGAPIDRNKRRDKRRSSMQLLRRGIFVLVSSACSFERNEFAHEVKLRLLWLLTLRPFPSRKNANMTRNQKTLFDGLRLHCTMPLNVSFLDLTRVSTLHNGSENHFEHFTILSLLLRSLILSFCVL